MKATLKIKPGCKAGSLYCGDCEFPEYSPPNGSYNRTCIVFRKGNAPQPLERVFNGRCKIVFKRCQQCLDSEQKSDIQGLKDQFGKYFNDVDPETYRDEIYKDSEEK